MLQVEKIELSSKEVIKQKQITKTIKTATPNHIKGLCLELN